MKTRWFWFSVMGSVLIQTLHLSPVRAEDQVAVKQNEEAPILSAAFQHWMIETFPSRLKRALALND